MMKKKVTKIEESEKNRIVDYLLQLGIFKVNGKQLYQVAVPELQKKLTQELKHAQQQYALK